MPYCNFRNKKIYYRIEGKGKPVLLLHGFGEDGNIWNKQVDALKKKNLLIIPDLPGSGQSEMLDGNATLEDYAEVIKVIADETVLMKEIENQFCLIGHSMGGYITLAFAEKYSSFLNSFGLFHSSAYADTDEKINVRKKAISFIKENGTEAFLKTMIPNLFSEESKKGQPELIEQLFNISKNISPETLIQYYKAMIKRAARASVLKSFKNPVLFIIGKNDTVIPLESSLEQCEIPSISTIHILQHSGHMGMSEEENLSNEFLSDFFQNFLQK